MAANQPPVEVEPQDLERAQRDWADFTMLMKYGIGVSVATLLLLLVFVY